MSMYGDGNNADDDENYNNNGGEECLPMAERDRGYRVISKESVNSGGSQDLGVDTPGKKIAGRSPLDGATHSDGTTSNPVGERGI